MPVVRRCQAHAEAGVGYITSKWNDTLANQKPTKVEKAHYIKSTTAELILNIILEYKVIKTNCNDREGCHKSAI